MMRSWLGDLFGKPTRGRRRFAPRLDQLEARENPATFYVDPAATVGTPVFNAGRPDAFTGTFGTDVFANFSDAVAAANAAAGPDTIRLANSANPSLITQPLNTSLQITDSLNVVGGGTGASILAAANDHNDEVVFITGAGVTVTFTDLSYYGGANGFDATGTVIAGDRKTRTAIKYDIGTTGTVERVAFNGIFGDGYDGAALAAVGAGASLTVRNSTFSSIGRVGVYSADGASLFLYSNTYTGKGAGAFLDYFAEMAADSTGVISGNTVTGNRGENGGDSAAVYVYDDLGGLPSNVQVFGNTFTGNRVGVIVGFDAADTTTATVSYNNILGNLLGVDTVRSPAATPIDATNVWWGTPTGPFNAANNPTGTGNDIADDVLFAPVRTAPVPVTAAPTLAQYLATAFPQTVSVALGSNAAEPATNGSVTFTRTGDSSVALTVTYTVGGTATAGADYTALSGTVTFAIGQTTVSVPVNVLDDALVEGTETVVVTLTASAAYTVSGSPATVNITDNDVLPDVTVATITNGAEPNTPGLLRFTRTGSTAAALTVTYTVGGTATNGVDYTALSGTVTFAAGSATADVPVNVLPDTAKEGTETVVVSVNPAAGYTTSGPAANLTIADVNLALAEQFAVGADAGGGAVVSFYNADGTVRFTQTVFGGGFTGGVRVAAADFNNDKIADVVVGTGPGIASRVRILDGVTGAELFSVAPFEATFTGGVFVAAGDITGDGRADLVITPDQGGGPRVLVYNGAGFGKIADFTGINDPAFRGGARPALGDINGDGLDDLVVAAGFGGGPRVSVYNGASIGNGTPTNLFPDFFVFETALRNGAFVAVGDVNGDGKADLIAGGGPGGGPRVRAFSGVDLLDKKGADSTSLINFFAGDVNNRGGIRVAVKNLDGDSRVDLVVGDGTGNGSRVTAYYGGSFTEGTATASLSLTAFPGFSGGVFVG